MIWLGLILATLSFGAGCKSDFDASDRAIPAPIHQFNDQFFRAIQAGNTGQVSRMLVPQLREAPVNGLEALSAGLAGEPSIKIKFGSHGPFGTEEEPLYIIESQASSAQRFFLVGLVLTNSFGGIQIADINVIEIPADAEATNGLALSGKPSGSIMGLAAAGGNLIFVFWCLLDCWRRKPRMQWLWIAAILISYPAILVNWGTGQWVFSPWHAVPFGVWTSQAARIHPMVIQVGFPLGALLWFFVRSRADLASEQIRTETLPPSAGSSSTLPGPSGGSASSPASSTNPQPNPQPPSDPASSRPAAK